jgi:hypothetical protein
VVPLKMCRESNEINDDDPIDQAMVVAFWRADGTPRRSPTDTVR